MAEITSALVKELREKTSAGMMDCKKALDACGGDIAQATDWLREKGILKAAKKSDRVAANGLVAVSVVDGKGVVVEVNAETDFVAQNDKFQSLVGDVVKTALEKDGDLDATRDAMNAEMTNMIATIGENMTIRRTGLVQADTVVSYVHNAVVPNMGKIGVLVGLNGGDKEKMAELGKKLAMHIAASKPEFRCVADVDPALVEKEKQFFIDSGACEGKPDNIKEKMVEGRISKYYAEIVFEEQGFVMDPDKKVKTLLEENGATLVSYVSFVLGDGIEKVEEDFAAEVAKML
jgi:elongation factor Ts